MKTIIWKNNAYRYSWIEDKKSIKKVKKEIEKYTNNVHCALYFLKKGDRITPDENEIFNYILEQKFLCFLL